MDNETKVSQPRTTSNEQFAIGVIVVFALPSAPKHKPISMRESEEKEEIYA